MKPVDIIADMLVHALKENSNEESLFVVFLIISKVVADLPGDNSAVIDWIDWVTRIRKKLPIAN